MPIREALTSGTARTDVGSGVQGLRLRVQSFWLRLPSVVCRKAGRKVPGDVGIWRLPGGGILPAGGWGSISACNLLLGPLDFLE